MDLADVETPNGYIESIVSQEGRYSLKLKTGDRFYFTRATYCDATKNGVEWIRLFKASQENHYERSGKDVDVRISEIVWICNE